MEKNENIFPMTFAFLEIQQICTVRQKPNFDDYYFYASATTFRFSYTRCCSPPIPMNSNSTTSDGIAPPMWQAVVIGGILFWMFISSFFNLTISLRSHLQPWVLSHVLAGDSLILQIQKCQHIYLDIFFSALSCVVSVPFYTAFLPLLFWSGHGKLARQMTLLMAFCDYTGNCLKDVVSAPRPSSSPVRRLTATKEEEENAMEYGLPSSHTLNTVCLSGYLLHYVLSFNRGGDPFIDLSGYAIVCLLVALIGFGRMYLGMHSLIDIIGGLVIGLVILSFWLTMHESLDYFIVLGQNVESFWAILSVLLLFAYPTPEMPTPSFEFHTAFDGVALGIVTGVRQTYHQFHHDQVPRIFTPELPLSSFFGRIMVGIPTILLVKICSKTLAKRTLPVISNTLGIPIRSTVYIPALFETSANKKSDETKQSGYLMIFFHQRSFDVDTGIRFLQYAGLVWAVVDLVPTFFSYLGL